MGMIDDFINGLTGSQAATPLTSINNNEFNGNTNDLLFNTDQSAQALSISGGTTLTAISPQNFINDLSAGKLTPTVWIWLAILGFVAWWLLKK